MISEIQAEAASWHAAQHRDDMDWTAFTAWLELPGRREAFDEVVEVEDLIDRRVGRQLRSGRQALHRSRDEGLISKPATRRRGLVPLAAIASAAAAAACLVAYLSVDRTPDRSRTWQADAGALDIDLGDGVRVSLSRGSVLTAATRDLRLSLTGRAVFDVRHEPHRRVEVAAQGYRISDIGTRFEVVTGTRMIQVGVAEGRVGLIPPSGRHELVVSAGTSVIGRADGSITASRTKVARLGDWRGGSFAYDGVPLGIVAADLARSVGRSPPGEGAYAGRSFTGVVIPSRIPDVAAALKAMTEPRNVKTDAAGPLPDRSGR